MGVEGNETTLTVLEKFANQNYAYGREWLTSQVRVTHIYIYYKVLLTMHHCALCCSMYLCPEEVGHDF